MNDIELLQEKAKLVRRWCLVSTTEAGSGHPTSCLSIADVLTVLFDKYYTYDLNSPLNAANDRFVLSKGHASPIFYTLYALAGAMDPEELMTLRKFGSRLEGHPTMHFPYTDAATGSLGQGLSVGAGMAYIQKLHAPSSKIQEASKTYVVLGDGELAEGQNWEAMNFASYYKLHNLVAIADINRLAQSDETMFGHRVDEYEKRFRAFGFQTIVIDGHNFDEISKAFEEAKNNTSDKPIAIIAKTFKGKGISFLEDKEGWHGKALPKADLEKALSALGDVDATLRFTLRTPEVVILEGGKRPIESRDPIASLQDDKQYEKGSEVATREVYGQVLASLGDTDERIYALDGDVKNSTFSIDFLKAHPERFIECFIAEQNMVSVAVGLSRLQKKPFVSTFGAFLTRAADQIRMASLSQANIAFCGSHAGVSIGEDGASQMALEDIALFGTIPGSIILHPSDAVSTAKLMPLLAAHTGISYLRTLRSKTNVLYDNDEEFHFGGSKILRSSQDDSLTVVAAGITISEALSASEILAKENIAVRIIDAYSIKPIDKEALLGALKDTKKKTIVTVEDHYEHGGLGDMVQSAIAGSGGTVVKMAVTHFSRSGKKDELLADAGIDANHIVETVRNLLQ